MSAMSDYLENKLVDHIFRGVSFTAPAALHVALFTAAPSDSGGGTEVSGGSYARAALASSVSTSAIVTGALSTAIRLNASLSGSATVTGALVEPGAAAALAGALTASATVSASLTGGSSSIWTPASASSGTWTPASASSGTWVAQ